MTTIGGCRVVDPYPAPRPRRPQGAAERAAPDPAERIRALVALGGAQGVPVGELPVRLGVSPTVLTDLLGAATRNGIVQTGDRLVPGTAAAGARAIVLAALTTFHRDHPLLPGMPLEAFRKLVATPELASSVQSGLEAEQIVVQERGVVRLAEHRARLPDAYAAEAYNPVVTELLDAMLGSGSPRPRLHDPTGCAHGATADVTAGPS